MVNKNKKLFVTYCTRDKTEDKEIIPAIQRYKSDRIKWVYNEAIKEKDDFAILSGIFGLIPPEKEISKYDYCLQENDVDRVKETNMRYIQGRENKHIVYFTKNPQYDRNIINYYDSLKDAIDELNKKDEKIDFEIMIIKKNYESFPIEIKNFEELIKKNKLKNSC